MPLWGADRTGVEVPGPVRVLTGGRRTALRVGHVVGAGRGCRTAATAVVAGGGAARSTGRTSSARTSDPGGAADRVAGVRAGSSAGQYRPVRGEGGAGEEASSPAG